MPVGKITEQTYETVTKEHQSFIKTTHRIMKMGSNVANVVSHKTYGKSPGNVFGEE